MSRDEQLKSGLLAKCDIVDILNMSMRKAYNKKIFTESKVKELGFPNLESFKHIRTFDIDQSKQLRAYLKQLGYKC